MPGVDRTALHNSLTMERVPAETLSDEFACDKVFTQSEILSSSIFSEFEAACLARGWLLSGVSVAGWLAFDCGGLR